MNFSLRILGCSSALPTSKRFPSAHLLNVNERFFLVDCGEGTQMQLRRFGVGMAKIDHVFISHLHGDHFFGLPGLISSFGLLGRTKALHIYAFPQLEKIINHLLDALGGNAGFPIYFHYLNPEKTELILDEKWVEVFSFPLEHSVSACGFFFREKKREMNIRKEKIDQYQIPLKEIVKIKQGADFITLSGKHIPNSELTLPPYLQRSYAYCSDTAFSLNLPGLLKGVHLLYHEATFLHKDKYWAWQTRHSTALEAAKAARHLNAKELVIGHYSARYKDIDELKIEAEKCFKPVRLAKDGMLIDIKEERVKRK